jgi:hypothetical protein
MTTRLVVRLGVPSSGLMAVASDGGATGVVDAGTGGGLSDDDQDPLAAGVSGSRLPSLEILTPAKTRHFSGDPGLPLEAGAEPRRDARIAAEAQGSVRQAGATGALEIRRIVGADTPLVDEARDTYVVAVTLTLSDGRVLTFPTMAASTSGLAT